MASNLRILTAATMFLGNEDPNASMHLSLKNFQLPALKAKTKEHMAGGAIMGLNINMGVLDPLEFNFKLEGIQPEAISKFMDPTGPKTYTVRGNLRNINEQTNESLVVTIRGIMTERTFSEQSRDDGIDSTHVINEVTFYKLEMNNTEREYADWAQGVAGFRINGVPIFAEVSRNLGLL